MRHMIKCKDAYETGNKYNVTYARIILDKTDPFVHCR